MESKKDPFLNTKGTREYKGKPLCNFVSACPRSLGVVVNYILSAALARSNTFCAALTSGMSIIFPSSANAPMPSF